MKKNQFLQLILSICLLPAMLSSCSKSGNNSKDVDYGNSPSTSIPSNLKGGIWFWRNIGPIAYYDRDGHHVGNETEAAREYVFSELNGQGRFEFTQYLGMRNASNCVTEIYTTKKGTVAFSGSDKLTLYELEGSFRTVKSGCSGAGSSTRKATSDDLKSYSYLWELKTFENEPLLYMYEVTDTAKENPIFVYSLSN